ncbi:MAG UNVERIFIED_CONTAM: amino acid transporter [Anaerolineae bacterium]
MQVIHRFAAVWFCHFESSITQDITKIDFRKRIMVQLGEAFVDESGEPSLSGDVEQATSEQPLPIHHGSSIEAVVFNFTNSIIGAGAIGLGGAIASSGGLISVAAIIFFAVLTEISLDMVIELSIGSSYEELGRKCYGIAGWSAVLISKMLYSFGCLIAYIVVVKENFSSALGHLLSVTVNEEFVTLALSTFVMLPLCLLRDMTPLSNLSLFSVASMGVIVLIVLYLYFFENPNNMRDHSGSSFEHWFQIRPGLLQSLGTFVFSFVSQHTVHLAFESLRPDLQSLQNWKRVSSWSIGLASCRKFECWSLCLHDLLERTGSDLFVLYPELPIIDIAKLLLCITMLLTFPFPFFTCRDMMIVAASMIVQRQRDAALAEPAAHDGDLDEPLLQQDVTPENIGSTVAVESFPSWLIAERQLKLWLHILVTFLLWAVTTTLALVAPNLGDVLNLVGCATGTVIAFILPSLFYFKLRGHSHTAATLLVVGGSGRKRGTFFSTRQLVLDASHSQ